jgi:hypothetical protein
MWSALCDERTGLSFTIAAGPRQRIFYCLRLETPPTWRARPRIYIPQEQGAQRNTQKTIYKHFTRTTQKTASLLFGRRFTASLHNNGSYSIAASVFVAAEMCLPSRCLAMNIYSYFTIPAFRSTGDIAPPFYTSAVDGGVVSSRFPLYRRLGKSYSQSRRHGEEKNLLLLPRIKPRLLCRLARSLVVIPVTE